MSVDFYPPRVLLATLAGWMNRQQQDVIAYLVEENRVLTEQLKGKRLRLNDDQRRRLAVPCPTEDSTERRYPFYRVNVGGGDAARATTGLNRDVP